MITILSIATFVIGWCMAAQEDHKPMAYNRKRFSNS